MIPTLNNKTFSHRPISELFAIVRNELSSFDQEGLIDEGVLLKTIMYCNERLGLPIREIREIAIPVEDYKAILPLDFEKLYYVCAVHCTNTMVHTMPGSPFNNNFDHDTIVSACLDRESLGCVENYQVVINRQTNVTIHPYGTWTQLSVNNADGLCHIDCPNKRKPGKYAVTLKSDCIETPFRSGTLYMVYIGMMKDEEGNITFPFHPLITPYYEWSLKEKIISNAIFNSDGTNLADKFKFAQVERAKAWLDAFNFTTEKEYGYYVSLQRKKELSWYTQYFRYFQ